jgi:selenocysteine-specific elongation factor
VPLVAVSARTGDGLEELRSVLVEQSLAIRPRQMEGRPFRQAVDRVFSLTGAGTVVTGTSLWGSLKKGDDVAVLPRGSTARVRRLHVHGEEQERVEAGERVAINLVGQSRSDIDRGDQILAPGPWQPTTMATARVELLSSAPGPLDEGDEVELHALAARVPARIDRLSARPLSPGGNAVAQIQLRVPMMLFPGDRVVLRRPSPVNTFAGGRVLDSRLPRWRRRESADLANLPETQRSSWPKLLASWIEREGLAGAGLRDLSGRLGVLDEAAEAPLGRLLEEGTIVALASRPPVFVAARAVGLLAAAAARELENRLADEEVSAGIPARDFLGRLVPERALGRSDQFLEMLRGRGVLELADGRVVPPGADSHMTEAGRELATRVDELYREAGFAAPSPAEAAGQLAARESSVEGICRFLTQRDRLVRLDGKFLIHRSTLDALAADVREWPVEDFAVGDFKQRFGLTRKLAIPAMEWLDSQRVTIRQGNRRKIVRR